MAAALAHDQTPDPDADPAPVGPLRLVVVDADERTRESIVGLLGIRDRFRVVGSSGDLESAVRLVDQRRPDIVIMDPRLPEVTGGLSLIRTIRRIDPAIRILALGWSPELEHDSIEAGADGYVRKTFKPADLADAVTRCMVTSPQPTPPAGQGRHARAVDAAGDSAEPTTVPTPLPGNGIAL